MTLIQTNAAFWLALLSLSIASGSAAWAAPMALIDPQLPGLTQYDEWAAGSLTSSANPGYPGFPGSGAWPGPIGSSAPGSGDANLNKIANGTGGGPYPAGSAIYYGGFSADINNNGGTLSVTDVTPVAGLSNLVLQIQIGEAWTYDFWNDVLPTLSYNGGTQDLAADDSHLLEAFFNGTVTMPTGEEAVYINTYLLQWDLSSLGPIAGVSIKFTGVQHAQLYALRLDQSDEYSPAVVPEPGTLTLAGMAGVGLMVACRTRRRSAA